MSPCPWWGLTTDQNGELTAVTIKLSRQSLKLAACHSSTCWPAGHLAGVESLAPSDVWFVSRQWSAQATRQAVKNHEIPHSSLVHIPLPVPFTWLPAAVWTRLLLARSEPCMCVNASCSRKTCRPLRLISEFRRTALAMQVGGTILRASIWGPSGSPSFEI